MTTQTKTTKANRGHLIRMAKAGRLFVKCSYSMSDDYAFDNANNFGKADAFSQVFLSAEYESPHREELNALYAAHHPKMPPETEIETIRIAINRDDQAFRAAEDKECDGRFKMKLWDFRTQSGHCSGTKESGSFTVHSNLCYEYEVR